ncbi:MAG: restriction endonuclease subunit S, partial [Aquabacterium sp.]|uniref:restriction endonuclease subunit S n=1 Tax=Aquabacterium sp. TaxID=1872578 RepID=UPI003BAFFDF1
MKVWQVPLEKVASYIKRGVAPKYVEDDGICVLNQKCVREGRVNLEPARLTDKNTRLAPDKVLQNGDILVNSTGTGTLGRTAYFQYIEEFEQAVVDTHITIVRPDTTIVNPRYLAYELRQNELAIVNMARGATNQVELSANDLSLLLVRMRDRREQDRIASILSAYDDLIENNRRRIQLLEQAARMLYREWFVHLRFPGHEHVKIKNGVPEGWERVPTPEAIEANPSTRLSDEPEHWTVEMADLPIDSMVIQQTVKREGRSGSKFCNGDTLFARITPCLENGKTVFVDFMEEDEVGRGSTEFIVLRSKRVTPEYVYCLARTYDFRENAIKSMVGSSGRQRVQESCFEKFLVLVPPSTLLTLFAD